MDPSVISLHFSQRVQVSNHGSSKSGNTCKKNWNLQLPFSVLIFCVEFRELSHLTRDLSQAEKKWYFVTKIVLTYCEKKCSSDREKLLKEAEGQEFAKSLR